ncbi:hypothetical protein AKJ44_02510 [candidate division MSBL1 archaeon SCGC-AAA261F17]|uniref:Uncharacterized protein n=1 Tax=candidate division MSBL1 archaeon SCGC-AAA261F17 TaxID=1698274 RepID=A0A133V4T9_9EURY|nr:hypothetical protein AKJ44_02510 [candidate division MSBL1 archaeon SCGC-AAA261F17]
MRGRCLNLHQIPNRLLQRSVITPILIHLPSELKTIMIELWFESEEDAEKAADELSEFGRPTLGKRVDTRFSISKFLETNYEEAVKELEEVSEELDLDDEENPIKHLKKSLTITRSLLEDGNYKKIAEAPDRMKAENVLYKTVNELESYRELKERVNQHIRKLVEETEESGEEERELTAEPEVSEEAADDLARYSLAMEFLINPVLSIVKKHASEENPLKSFNRNVHLDVTPISNSFDDLKQRIDLEARMTYTVKLGIEHVLRMEDVVQRLRDAKFLNSAEDVLYRFLTLHFIASEVLSSVRGKKKMPYEEFVRGVKERINTSIRELGEESDALPYTTDEAVRWIVQKLKRVGLVRKKGNKISEV